MNTYVYTYNNPLRWSDPTGLFAPIAVPIVEGIINTIGGGIVLWNALKLNCPKKCPPCTPYPAGTIGYLGPHTDHDHYPVGRPHLNLRVVNQDPESCKCFWNKNKPDVAAPPPKPEWVNLNNGFPALSP
jgi:hypothetical protein